jgi:uncharacterized protein (DUF488 family)
MGKFDWPDADGFDADRTMPDPIGVHTGQPVFTIGHSTHQSDWFVNLITRYEIEVLVDIRSHPFSQRVPHFDLDAIRESVRAAGIRYVYLGRELGGRPADTNLYDEDGRVLYGKVAETPLFQTGIERLEKGVRRYRVALMCSEEDPAGCHRRLLVGRVLAGLGILSSHIRGDGTVETEDNLSRERNSQIALFDGEESEWKSLQSVLHRSRPKRFSAR